MGAFDARPRALVIVAFAGSAALFAGAATALVAANRDDDVTGTLPRANPTLVPGGSSPSAEPVVTDSPEASPAATASATASAAASASASARATSSASPRASTSASAAPRPTKGALNAEGLFVDAVIDPADGATYAKKTVFRLSAHATDGDGTIRFVSVSWGDGTRSTSAVTRECAATGRGDCKDFAVSHVYSTQGSKDVTLTITSGPAKETSVLLLGVKVNNAAPTPTASPSSSPSPSASASASS